jgi:hypothetical protein
MTENNAKPIEEAKTVLVKQGVSSFDLLCQFHDEIPIVKKGCIICENLYRAEAEELYDKTKNAAAVHRFLLSKKVDISHHSVTTHFKNHYEAVKMNNSIKEYAENMKNFKKKEVSGKAALLDRKSILFKLMLDIVSKNEGVKDSEENRKNSETAAKLNAAICVIEDKIENLEKQMEPALLIMHAIQKVCRFKSQTVDEKGRQLILDILEGLDKEVDGILIKQ